MQIYTLDNYSDWGITRSARATGKKKVMFFKGRGQDFQKSPVDF
jgi:hypothetical protein